MDEKILGKINKKIKEINSLKNLNSKDLKFKTWHISTVNLLKMLPSDFIRDTGDFKKLTFSDTKYHRGAKPFGTSDNTRYVEDLDKASKILKKITSVKKEKAKKEVKAKESNAKK